MKMLRITWYGALSLEKLGRNHPLHDGKDEPAVAYEEPVLEGVTLANTLRERAARAKAPMA